MRTSGNDLSISYSILGTYPFGCPFSAIGFLLDDNILVHFQQGLITHSLFTRVYTAVWIFPWFYECVKYQIIIPSVINGKWLQYIFFPIQTGYINHNISLCKTWGIVNSLNTRGILGRREIEDKKRRLERKLAEIY